MNDKTTDNIELGRNAKSSQSVPSDTTGGAGGHDIENARSSNKGVNDTDLVDKELEELEAQVKEQLRKDPEEEDYWKNRQRVLILNLSVVANSCCNGLNLI